MYLEQMTTEALSELLDNIVVSLNSTETAEKADALSLQYEQALNILEARVKIFTMSSWLNNGL